MNNVVRVSIVWNQDATFIVTSKFYLAWDDLIQILTDRGINCLAVDLKDSFVLRDWSSSDIKMNTVVSINVSARRFTLLSRLYASSLNY